MFWSCFITLIIVAFISCANCFCTFQKPTGKQPMWRALLGPLSCSLHCWMSSYRCSYFLCQVSQSPLLLPSFLFSSMVLHSLRFSSCIHMQPVAKGATYSGQMTEAETQNSSLSSAFWAANIKTFQNLTPTIKLTIYSCFFMFIDQV